MMLSQIHRPSWQLSSFTDSTSNEFEQSFTEILSPFHHFPSDFSESVPSDDYPIDDLLMDAEFDLDSLLSFEFGSPDGGVSAVAEEIASELIPREAQWSPSSSLRSGSTAGDPSSATQQAPEFMEADNQLSLHHLMKAYGEAMENDQVELMEVIRRCAAEKADPYGESVERLAFYLFCRNREEDYRFLADESKKNSDAAFNAFYQIVPIGRFAHFAANRAILESIPPQIEVLRVVDLEIGEGIQWAPVIDAIGMSPGSRIALKITSIKSGDEDEGPEEQIDRHFRLRQHAAALGVYLTVEEMKIDELFQQTRRDPREWTAFNCMVGLPHMGRGTRSRCHVEKFLAIAQQITSVNGGGIITFADGDGIVKTDGFGEFFEERVRHYQKLLEVMDGELPSELAEARLAMESLFVSPCVSSSDWACKWEEIRAGLNGGIYSDGGRRRRISRENVMEAMELVRGKSSYGVRVADMENEMVLHWKDTPIVRFTIWGR